MKRIIGYLVDKSGYTIVSKHHFKVNPHLNMDKRFLEIANRCKNYTMTSIEKVRFIKYYSMVISDELYGKSNK